MITIRPIKSMTDFENLRAAAESDGHLVLAPTHVVTKDNILIGGLELIPSAFVWMDTRLAKIRDSLELMRFTEAHLASGGNRLMVLPCKEDSPYFKYVPQIGFSPLPHKLFIKGL